MTASNKLPPSSFFRTGMTDDKLKAIGLVTLMWNSLEWELQHLIATIADWRTEVCRLVTADMQNLSRLQLARNLLCESTNNYRLREEVGLALSIFDACRVMRNALVHGTPAYGDNKKLCGIIVNVDAKGAKGALDLKRIEVTDQFLADLVSDLNFCGDAIADAERKVQNLRQYLNDPGLQQRESLDCFVFGYRAPPLDTLALKSRQDSIVLRHPKKTKALPQPQPSQASPQSD